MGRVGRLAGALIARTGERWFLVGNPKEPFDFAAAGWDSPGVVDALARPYIELRRAADHDRDYALEGSCLEIDVEDEALARLLDERMVIRRNASVSERLWRLVVDTGEATGEAGAVDARWLAAVPAPVWQAVRDTVLRCS